MRLTSRESLVVGIAIAGLVAGMEQTAMAQGQPRSSEDLRTESTGPQDPRSTGSIGRSNEPLSDKLDSTGGVIRPPADIAPDMTVRPPIADPNTTRVIPPPGAPGGNQTVEPK